VARIRCSVLEYTVGASPRGMLYRIWNILHCGSNALHCGWRALHCGSNALHSCRFVP
jgi:hypothetical protein